MNSSQKTDKIRETKKNNSFFRKALMFGLASVVTVAASGEEKTESGNSRKKENNKEIKTADFHENSTDCAYYINNVILDADSPIEQIYKVDKRKAFYSCYLNGGKGGIVFTKYQISDADLYENANQRSAKNYEKTLNSFAERASKLGYKEEIKGLEDVQKCLDFYSANNRKKDKHIGEFLLQACDENGLSAALNLKKTINKMNAANLETVDHEEIHASIGQYMKNINTGEVMLTPGGIYLARMADELRAQIKGGNIAATEQGLEYFFDVCGEGYYESYTSGIGEDDSYKRMFAYSLNEEKAERKYPAEINNLFLGYDTDGIDNLGNTCTINGVETTRGYVFFSGQDNVSSAKMKNGRNLHLNCLVDAEGRIIKDKDGKKIPARVIYNEGIFTVAMQKSVLSTKDMDKNLKKALQFILQDLDDSAKKLVLKALDKHCREDADKLTNALLGDNDGMMKLRSETDAGHVAEDLKYIKEKRAVLLQEVNEKNLLGLDLVQIASPKDNALQLSVSMFKQNMNNEK